MVLKKYLKYLLLFVSAILLTVFFIITNDEFKKDKQFSNFIQKCNTASSVLRFSCYRSGIEKYYKDNPDGLIKKTMERPKIVLESKDTSYAIFGTNLHTFYHAVGDFIAENVVNAKIDSTTISYLLKNCPPISITSGCMMGLYKRLALKNHYSTDFIKLLYQQCSEEGKGECAHEIGHILHDKYTYSILKILDEILEKQYGLKQNNSFQYVTFKNSNLNMSFEECRAIIPKEKGGLDRCFRGIGHNLFLFFEFSSDGYKSVFNECSMVKELERTNCFVYLIFRIGINEAAPHFLLNQFEEGKKVCDEALKILRRKDLARHCYTGIGNGIGIYIHSEYGTTKIEETQMSGIKKDLLKWGKLCDKLGTNSDFCYTGLLGTKFRKLYFNLDMYDDKIEKILRTINKDFVITD